MKTAKITFMALCAAAAVVSCQKSSAPTTEPWVNDESMKVPVQIVGRTAQMTTKAGEINSLAGVEFGVYALGDTSKPQPVLFQDQYEIGSNCLPSTIDDNNMAILTTADGPAYYPLYSTNNYTFYGFHVDDAEGVHTYVEEDSTVAITNYGLIDVLWSEPAKATPVDDPDKGLVEGFCAKYIRSIYKLNLQSQYLPKLHFEHQTAEFIIRVKAADQRAEESFLAENGNVRITDAVVKNIPTSARLNVIDGSIIEGAEVEDKACDIPAAGIRPVYSDTGVKVSEFFLSPSNPETLNNVEFNFTLRQNAIENETHDYTITGSSIRAKFEEDPAFDGFKKGYRYFLTLTISSAEKIEILVSLEPWKDGFTGNILDIE